MSPDLTSQAETSRQEQNRLHRWIFEPPDAPYRLLQIVAWWEARRIPYNLAIIVPGVISYVAFNLSLSMSDSLGPGEDGVEPLALVMGMLGANFFYSLGCLADIRLRRSHPQIEGALSPRLFKLGVLFSQLVIFFPSAVALFDLALYFAFRR